MQVFLVSVTFAAGFALCWFAKDWLVKTVSGAEAFAKSLEAKAAAVRAVV